MNATVYGPVGGSRSPAGAEDELFGERGIGGVTTGVSKECLLRLASLKECGVFP